jgi:hypothetical protein
MLYPCTIQKCPTLKTNISKGEIDKCTQVEYKYKTNTKQIQIWGKYDGIHLSSNASAFQDINGGKMETISGWQDLQQLSNAEMELNSSFQFYLENLR